MKCILIGSGEFNNDVITKQKDDLVIAVDGGYNYLKESNIVDLIIGDLDSINNIPQNIKIIKYPKDKDYTDMDLAIKYAKELGYTEFDIYAAMGKRLEHTLANISLLLKYKELSIKLIDRNLTCFILENNIYELNKKGLISIFSLTPESIITIKGLKYELNNKTITNSFPIGLDNEAIGNSSYIKVTSGIVLIMTRFEN